jgi:hypothetical protein
MEITINTYKKQLGVKWIKAASGNTYLCPTRYLAGIDSPSEDQLKALCVDESKDPQNS